MSVQFTIGNFGHPVAIWKLHRAFDVSQWFSSEQFVEHQGARLRMVLGHAYATVPYYRDVFQRAGLTPEDIRDVADLQKLPILTKAIVRREGSRLQSAARHYYRPQPVSTSGTTGEPISVLLDKPSNVLEFVYYWRHWGWAGYRLGARFAEFSADNFLGCDPQRLYKFQPGLGRLLLNSMAISDQSAGTQLRAMMRYRPRFLKGLASVLHYFSIFARGSNLSGIQLRAVFSTGEMLLPLQRRNIEETFGCKVYDSYGHMERTVAVSECSEGGFHINPEYGVMELVPLPKTNDTPDGVQLARIMGTSLHNFSMPLIRYDVGDIAEVCPADTTCPCGRRMPRIRRINGRLQDAVITPDGRVVTSMFIVFEKVPGIIGAQIVQREPTRLIVRIAQSSEYTAQSETDLIRYIKEFVGPSVSVHIAYLQNEALREQTNGKYRAVVSDVAGDTLARTGHAGSF